MSAGENHEALDRDLHDRAAQRAVGPRKADLVSRALELASATRSDDRAWALVRLAADLRALGRYEDGLTVLDVACSLSPSFEPERAIFTCAIAIHCDLGEHATAATLEHEQAERSIDVMFARACARLYAELYTLTQSEEHCARRDSYVAAIASLEAEASVAA